MTIGLLILSVFNKIDHYLVCDGDQLWSFEDLKILWMAFADAIFIDQKTPLGKS